MLPKFDLPAGTMAIDGPKPYLVEYPFGLPGDGIRRYAESYKATCISYHRGVDPRSLAGIENGNKYRYGPGDDRYEEIKRSMEENGFLGGDGQRLIIHVDADRAWIAEGNHRLRIALEVGVPAVEVEIRYRGNTDEKGHLIPFDPEDPEIRVISD